MPYWCMLCEIKNEIGNIYGRLRVVSRSGRKHGAATWLCVCDCGNETTVKGIDLRRRHTQSCGCLHSESAAQNKNSLIDLRTKHPLYAIYRGMLNRCYDKKHKGYRYYGAKGITVCAEWKNDFWAFVRDMGTRPENHSLDRKDGRLGYYKDNCKWSTAKEQNNNQVRYY